MTRDYYRILGVNPEASPDEIKSAYRKGAMRLHPDQSGEGAQPFRDLKEAYDVLADAHLRRCYDEEHANESRVRTATCRQSPESLRRRRCPIEPLIPSEPARGSRYAEEEWRRRYLWSEIGEVAAGFHVEVELDRDQALLGGYLRVWLPVQSACPDCRGQGSLRFFTCPTCRGKGLLRDDIPLDLSYGPGVTDGCVGRLVLRRRGGQDLRVSVRFRVSAR